MEGLDLQIRGDIMDGSVQTIELPKLLTVSETQSYLGVSKNTLYSLLQQRDFPAFKVGREWRVDSQKLYVWIDKQSKKFK